VIVDNGFFGLLAAGSLTSTVVQSSTISGNGATGVRLVGARGITVGGVDLTTVNGISDNPGWGILATGWSRGSTLLGNGVSNNGRGDVNTIFAIGLRRGVVARGSTP